MREEYDAAQEIVDGILEDLTRDTMKTTENIEHNRDWFRNDEDLNKTNVIRTTQENMTSAKHTKLIESISTNDIHEKPKGIITDMWDKLRTFKGDTTVELRIWLRRYELALEMKHPDQSRKAMEYMKLYFLEDFLQDKAKRLYCTALDKPGPLSYGQVVSYITERLEEPINKIRANMERLKFYRESTSIHQHFTDFLKKTMAAGNMMEEVLMGNISEQEATDNPRLRDKRTIQGLIKLEYLYTLPRHVGPKLEKSLEHMTLMEIQEEVIEILQKEKERRNYGVIQGSNFSNGAKDGYRQHSHPQQPYKQGFKGARVNMIDQGGQDNTRDANSTQVSALTDVQFVGPVIPHIFATY
ncbi:Hypothetical protein SRAE_X000200400 [Strongyloides ratti]|uniref:Retrotransposon gag domain-containing protein n=1 Tax=Strongyloides ratti TaxID=34506 RepID=A0A090KSA0_STRRB|nr:Hypothetical protein SRAE_X000200400 [Strongyloides ratti]CEF60266.1 Hypothetical protein SRAE_X000200400 [Strongyloides ratti]